MLGSRRRRAVAPTGVVLTLRDGDVVGPLPLRYQGRCHRHGRHQWLALAAEGLAARLVAVSMDLPRPPHSEVWVVFLPDEILGPALNPTATPF